MPIELITGAPGNGKSLFTLWTVEKRRQAENRPVYYSGIADLNLPWIEFGDVVDKARPHMTDASGWPDLPDGSIIVIDECQRLFRPRGLAKELPRYVSELETHRHHGFDIYIITQHPTLVDTNVRRLVETHYHLMRKFGAKWSTIHMWKGCKENCDKSRRDSQETEFRFPKEVFGWYKSAEVHTVKLKVPKKVVMLLLLPFVIALGVWFAVTRLGKVADNKPAGSTAAGPQLTAASMGPGGAMPGPAGLRRDASMLYADLQPRIPDLPYTAPRYDALTQPVRVPVIVGCWMQGEASACMTQQGSILRPSLAFIKSFIKNGTFQDFDAGPGLNDVRQAAAAPAGAAPPGFPGTPALPPVAIR